MSWTPYGSLLSVGGVLSAVGVGVMVCKGQTEKWSLLAISSLGSPPAIPGEVRSSCLPARPILCLQNPGVWMAWSSTPNTRICEEESLGPVFTAKAWQGAPRSLKVPL